MYNIILKSLFADYMTTFFHKDNMLKASTQWWYFALKAKPERPPCTTSPIHHCGLKPLLEGFVGIEGVSVEPSTIIYEACVNKNYISHICFSIQC